MSAPKTPVLILFGRSSFKIKINLSYKGIAISGEAERIKLGRFPFFVDANKVN